MDIRTHGYQYVRGVLSAESIALFADQLNEELNQEGPDAAANWAEDRTTQCVSLDDASTWPRKGDRRVVELAPLSKGAHWDELLSAPKLRDVLDALLGVNGWELPLNSVSDGRPGPGPSEKVGTGHTPDASVRHWYCPVVFPESPDMPTKAASSSSENCPARDTANVKEDPRRALEFEAASVRYRPMLLCPCKEELRSNGNLREEEAWWRWQPVNRRRVLGKGWHIDIGPGFDLCWERTLAGHPYQGVVALILLSDWLPGHGGTVLATGSHEWVRGQIEARASADGGGTGGGVPHKELNQGCIDHMLRLGRSGRLWIPLDQTAAPGDPAVLAAAAGLPPVGDGVLDVEGRSLATPEDGVGYTLHQVCGRAGDVLLMHPWLVHCGSVNLSKRPRLMANGMVRIRQEQFDADSGARLLRSVESKGSCKRLGDPLEK